MGQLQAKDLLSSDAELPFDELAETAKDNVTLAKTRLDWMMRRFKDGA
jgi:hypothetical protein